MNCQSHTLAIAFAGSPLSISDAWTASARERARRCAFEASLPATAAQPTWPMTWAV